MRTICPDPSRSPRGPRPRRSLICARGCGRRAADAPEDAGWSLGTDLGYLGSSSPTGRTVSTGRRGRRRSPRLPRFRVPLGRPRIHFVHVRAAAPAGPVLPLVLSHGWPDSFWRYAKVVPLLTDPGAHGADPADAFDVSCPTCRATATPTAPPARRWTPSPSPACGATHGRARLPAVRRGRRDVGSHVSR